MTGFTYPKEVGGQGGEAWQERMYEEEAAEYEASSGFIRSTIAMLGPTLMAFGTEAQQRELVPRLLSGEDAWCQLFSEPGAGSDLASLGCRAVRDGDDFVVTGQKVWNSAAQWCDRGMLLARTNPDAPKHHGITFLLVDMRSAGHRGPSARPGHGGRALQRGLLRRRAGPGCERARRDRRWLGRGAGRDGERVGDDRWFGGSSGFAKLLLLAQRFGVHRRSGRAPAPRRLLRASERSVCWPTASWVRSAAGSGLRSIRRS